LSRPAPHVRACRRKLLAARRERDLVRTCHRRGAHAMGGMAALVPSRSEPDANEKAIAGVREDKKRVTREIFERVALGEDFLEFPTLIAYDKVD
jgi:hypothetical protein